MWRGVGMVMMWNCVLETKWQFLRARWKWFKMGMMNVTIMVACTPIMMALGTCTRTHAPHAPPYHTTPSTYTQMDTPKVRTPSLSISISLSLSIYLPQYLLMVKCIPLRISNKILVKSIKKSMALKNPYHTYKPHFIKTSSKGTNQISQKHLHTSLSIYSL